MYAAQTRLFYGDTPYNTTTDTFRYNVNMDTTGFNFNNGTNFTVCHQQLSSCAIRTFA